MPWVKSVAVDFFFLSFVLFLCVYYLISKLLKKRDQVTGSSQVDKDIFNHEIHALLGTLILFSSTYILRGVWLLKSKPNTREPLEILIGLLVGIVCDFVPVTILLAFHFKNFNSKQTDATEQDVVSPEDAAADRKSSSASS